MHDENGNNSGAPNDTPNDPAVERRRQETKNLAEILRAVHSSLIQSLKNRRQAELGRTLTPLEWFQLLSRAPEYRWMQPLTEAMSDIDALLDRRSLTENDFAAVREALARLFSDRGPAQAVPGDFKNAFFDAMTVDPGLVMAHAALKKAIDALPVAEVDGDLAEIRRSWHVSERRLALQQKNKPKS